MASYIQKTKDFFTSDGQITKKGLLASTALGGLYFGLPLYLAIKKIGSIREGIDKTQTAFNTLSTDYKNSTGTGADFFKAKAKSLSTWKNWGIAGALALGATGLGFANHYTSFENENANRLSHFGATGFFGKAVAGASLDYSKTGAAHRGFFESLGPRLAFKTVSVGSAAVDGTIDAAKTTAKIAGQTVDGAAGIVSTFADPEDKEGKLIFAKPLSEKFITVCVNRSDFSNPIKDADGSIKWEKKTGTQAEADNAKIPAYVDRVNKEADEYKKPGSAFRRALEQSASGIMLIEPGYIKDSAKITYKEGTSCPDLSSKEYKYNAETWLNSQGKGHLPAGPIAPGK